MESQVPRRIPGILPLVGHGDDVTVEHMKPLGIAGLPLFRSQYRMSVVLEQPFVEVEIVILFGPQHARQRLAVYAPLILGEVLRRDAIVELVSLGQTRGKDFVELRKCIGRGFVA